MIKAYIVRDSSKFVWEFSIKGHAGYGEHGSDIVCAAVSAIAYTALGALEEMTGVKNYTEKDGLLKCSIPLNISDTDKRTAEIILNSMVIGLKQIEYSYGKYVSVLDEEV
jgi:uncharacterized protein